LATKAGDDPRITDLIRDCEGQAAEAVSKSEWFTRWGIHYLRSLCVAHQYEICNNFKDPGVQHYGGELFGTIRDNLDEIFRSLPPPKHSAKGSSYGYTPSASASAPVDMSRFMDIRSGCFAGSCSVTLADGAKKRVADVCKGDMVCTGSTSESTAKVICVVEHPAGCEVCVLSPSKLVITPWHPVDLEGDGKWSFPCNCGSVEHQRCEESVYTFVLDRAHSAIIDGIRCVTLAHGITSGDDVRAHPYFGSNACIADLQKHFPKDFEAGHVTLPQNIAFSRDSSNKLVNGLHIH